jgi:transcriptional regulator with XRE-family HTH domain
MSLRGIAVLVVNTRHKHLSWLQAIMAHKRWSQTDLARNAGIDPSTLSRFFREVNPGAMLQSHTVEKIAAISDIPPFQTMPPVRPRGFAETEAAPYQAETVDDMLARAVQAAKAGKNGVDAWVLKSRAIELAGYLPGDILIVDLNAEPVEGDVVCAQFYDRQGRAETVFRIYEPPFLVAVSTDTRLFKPLLVEADRVVVRGVMRVSLRPQRSIAVGAAA